MHMSDELNAENTTYEEEGISLSELFTILKRHIGWCILGFVIVTVCGVAYIQTAKPEYESTSTILVNPIQQSSTMDSLLSQDFTGSKKIATEAELLSSSLNITRTLADMDLNLYTDNNDIPYSDATIFGGPGAASVLKKRLTITTVKDTNIVKLTISDNNPRFAHDFMEKLCKSYDVILTDIAKNSKSAQRQFIENQIPINDVELKKATDALGDFRKNSDIIQLSDKTSLLVSESVYYQMKLEPLQMEYQEAQVGINQFQKDWESASFKSLPTPENLKNDKEISNLLSRLNDLQEELSMYEAVSALNIAGGANVAGGTGTVVGVNSTTISKTNQTQSRTNDLNNSIIQVKKGILDRVTAICGTKGAEVYYQAVTKLLATEVQIKVLKAREKVYSDELGKLPDLQTRLSELEREVTVYETVGLKLRDMLQETKLVEAAVNSNVTIVDVASMPIRPVKPNKKMILAVAALLGLAIGVLLALLVNSMDDSIDTWDQLKKVQGEETPVLTWIPFFIPDRKNKYPTLVVYNEPLSFQAERFKLVSNLFYTNRANGKVFSVTSCGMSEGKSTVIANIAVSMAQMGKKVLLIDGDLRMPSLMSFFRYGTAKVDGLVDVVLGKTTLDKAILKPIDDIPNLHFLPAGTKPLVPSAVFTNPHMEELLHKMERIYDFIIIDAPPLIYASELLPIGKLVSGVLIVARAGITSKTELRELINTFSSAKVRIAGTVFNACGRSAVTSGYNSRYSGYYGGKYGYGYGYSSTSKSGKKSKANKQHSWRWFLKQYKKDVRNRGKLVEPFEIPVLAFPDGLPVHELHTDVYDPLEHHTTSASLHDDPGINGLDAIEKDEMARGKN